MTNALGLPTPAELGAGSSYTSWRENQERAFAAAINTSKFAIALNLPTGSGKTLIGVSWHLLSQLRTVILTQTRGLATQYMEQVQGAGLRLIEGMARYPCDGMTVDQTRLWRMTSGNRLTPMCDDGPCHDGQRCELRQAGCRYYDAIRAAGGFTITNYAFWLANQEFSQEKIGPYDLLICDEADAAPDELCKHLSCEILTWEIENLLRVRWPAIEHAAVKDWAGWASASVSKIDRMLDPDAGNSARGRERRMLRQLSRKLSSMTHVGDEEARWLVSDTPKGKRFEPLWPAPYRNLLFREAKQVAFLSATVAPKTLTVLGLTEPEFEYHQFASSFPIERRPIYALPIVQVKHTTPRDDMNRLISAADDLIRLRQDRKGLIHTVSYKLASLTLKESRYSHLMVSHEDGRGGKLMDYGRATVFRTVAEAVAYFRAHPGPCYLVSPSVSRGYDFPGREAELNIILKLAFPDTRDPVMDARCKEDEEYWAYTVMKELVQQTGRTTRRPDDFSETFLLDASGPNWFFRKWGYLAPLWWAEAYMEVGVPPLPPAIRAA